MFNKLELNNQITSLKGEVQKTRAQVIQRLIKRITFLKQKVDANPKLANKVEVIAKEIKILKKLQFRDLVKKALLLEKSPKLILTSASSTPAERCLARVWEHKKFSKTLETLKSAFELDKPENQNVLRNMGAKKKKKKGTNVVKKPMKAKGVVTEKNVGVKKKIAMEFVEESVSEEDSTENVKTKLPKSKRTHDELSPAPKKIIKKPKTKRAKFSDDEEDLKKDEKTEDSFFVTSSGQSYLAAVPKMPSNNSDVGSKTFSNGREKKPFNNSNSFNVEVKKIDDDLHPSWKAKQRLKEIKPFQGKKVVFSDEGEIAEVKLASKPTPSAGAEPSLHPSWIAKQKAKPVIAEFTGKKIKFD